MWLGHVLVGALARGLTRRLLLVVDLGCAVVIFVFLHGLAFKILRGALRWLIEVETWSNLLPLLSRLPLPLLLQVPIGRALLTIEALLQNFVRR